MTTSKFSVRLLHLEDNPRAAQLVRDRLRSDGLICDIVHVDNRHRFEAASSKREFDLVLCDYNIASYDGSSVMKQVQRAQPDVPVIFISGAMGDDQRPACLEIGAADCVLKYRLEQLAPAMKRALRAASGRRLRVDRVVNAPKCRALMSHVPSAAAA